MERLRGFVCPDWGRIKSRANMLSDYYSGFFKNGDSGFVYFIRDAQNCYKIGKAKNIVDRFTQLRKQYPSELELVTFFICDNPIQVERQLHSFWKHRKLYGYNHSREWFDLDDTDIRKYIGIDYIMSEDNTGAPEPGDVSFGDEGLLDEDLIGYYLLDARTREPNRLHWVIEPLSDQDRQTLITGTYDPHSNSRRLARLTNAR